MDLTELIKSLGPGKFQPVPVCFQDGRRIEWHWSNDSFYAEPQMWENRWIGDIYRSQETNEIVGVAIHLEAIRGAKLQLSEVRS